MRTDNTEDEQTLKQRTSNYCVGHSHTEALHIGGKTGICKGHHTIEASEHKS